MNQTDINEPHEWIEIKKELPPCDGWYEIQTNNFDERLDKPIMLQYDGLRFIGLNCSNFIMILPIWKVEKWRHCKQPKKLYGKVNEIST